MNDVKFLGLDLVLVDRIHFIDTTAKSEYLKEVEKVLHDLSIKLGDDRLEVINKIAETDPDLPLLREILAYSEGLQYSQLSDRGNYYTNCTLCEFNLYSKLEAGIQDFAEEEILFQNIQAVELNNYARISLSFKMGNFR